MAYTNTVSIPVNRNAHHAQFPETPFCRTRPVTKFGVSVENVVATILTPNSHHGIFRPARKTDFVSLPACFDAQIPTAKERTKYAPMMVQSNDESVI